MDNRSVTIENAGREITELNDQFSAFLHTKGIKAKCRLALAGMNESARRQQEADRKSFEAVKERSAEENRDFVEFLHTKGVKAKAALVAENIKKGAAEAPARTAEQAAQITVTPPCALRLTVPGQAQSLSAQTLSDEFNAFLEERGLAGKYHVAVTEEAEP